MKKIAIRRIEITNRKEKALYLVLLFCLVVMYASYIPCLMDYYIVRPEQSFLSFYQDSFVEAPYTFEGIVIGMTIAAFYCLTMRSGISTLIVSAFLFILTHASYIKYINRKELLRLDDLRLTEAAGMALDYFRFTLKRWLVLLAGVFVLFVGAGFALDLFRKKAWRRHDSVEAVRKEKGAGGKAWKVIQEDGTKTEELRPRRQRGILACARLLGCICLCAAIVLYTDHFLGERYVIDAVETLFPKMNRYVLCRFLQNDSLSAISVERAEESYDFLLSQEPAKEAVDREEYPNVIVIMNESWWNTDNIQSDRITFSQDPMEPYKALADRCVTGSVTTTVFGGGTVTPEIEFMTGLNDKYGSVYSVYTLMEEHRTPSLVDYFNGLDYETVAIHPFYGHFYGRDAAYAAMGFDRVIFEEDMQYRDIYTRYISDESLAKQIVAIMEEGSSERKFIWALSMANHKRVLDYPAKPAADYEYPISMTVNGEALSEEDYDTVRNYVNGIYLANHAFSQLVDYFSEQEEPTVLLMFGDHCPNFSVETLEALGLGDEDGEGKSAVYLYSTPAIMWSNVPHGEQDFSGESIYYLPQVLIDYAGLPDADMTRILRYERSYFKTNSPQFVRDAAGEELYECTEEQLRALNHYKVVQYDILHGEENDRNVWQPDT